MSIQQELFAQTLIIGLTTGSYLALIALGYTMVYGIVELINFAHGDIFAVGYFVSLALFQLFLPGKPTLPLSGANLYLLLPLILFLTMFVTGSLNVIIDRIAYRPLRKAPRLAPLLTAIGVSFILEASLAIWKGALPVPYPRYFPRIDVLDKLFGIQTKVIDFTTKDLFLLSVTIPLMMGLALFIDRTRLGKAMRACAQDREVAAMMGINVNRIIAITFFIGGALAGAAGLVIGLYLNNGRFLMGFEAGLMAFSAAVLGGIGNIRGAVLGAFIIGVVKALSDTYFSTEWTRVVIFSILVLLLVFRPSGILGSTQSIEKI